MRTTLTFRIANLELGEEIKLTQLMINLVRTNEITQDEFFSLYKQLTQKYIDLKKANK
jgi:hypothetical protein